MKNSKILFISLLAMYVYSARGQQVTSSSGSYFTSGNIQMSWTIGEPVIETCMVGNSCITQGMHQSNLIVSAIGQLSGLNLEIMAYPNPASEFVQLKVKSSKEEDLMYQLYEANGELLYSGVLEGNQAVIPMQSYAHATYLLKVVSGNSVFKTFKIVKN